MSKTLFVHLHRSCGPKQKPLVQPEFDDTHVPELTFGNLDCLSTPVRSNLVSTGQFC